MKRRDPDSTTFAPILGDKQAAIGLIERHVLARYREVLADTATKINAAHQKAQHHAGQAIDAAKEVGAMLLEVKKQLPHGQFLPWVSANCTVSERQAQRYMAAAQGKPMPVRAIKCDTVSLLPKAVQTIADTTPSLTLKDNEAVHLRIDGAEVYILPHKTPGVIHLIHFHGNEQEGWECSYTQNRGVYAKWVPLLLNYYMPNWWSICSIERFAFEGVEKNPLSDDGMFADILAGGGAA